MTPEIMQKIYKMTPSQKMQVDEIVAFWLMKRTALDGIPLLPAHKIKVLSFAKKNTFIFM